MIVVRNMATGAELTFTNVSPLEALCAAYGYAMGNGSTWTFAAYAAMVQHGRAFLFLGDWAVRAGGVE